MKKTCLALFIPLLLSACEQYPQEKMGIATYNMQYTDGPNYKIFSQRSNINQDSIDKVNYDYTSPNFSAMKKHIATLLRQQSQNIGDEDDNQLVGRNVEIRFSDPQMQQQFDADVSVAAICFYYYFEGQFIQKQVFEVDKYRLFERKKDCEVQSQKTWEQIITDANNDDRLAFASEASAQ